ncbi:MAG: helix-turn-helix domain-containing protein [Candidatus Binataceae bacterium]|nr:helix-turn-helix domain-containing protein [Candidatus Binataceae bacterium]
MAISAELLRRTREARRLTQVELARRTGISRQALGAIEAGLYQPGVTVALALARELGETVENLFGAADSAIADHVGADWSEDARPAEADRPAGARRVALARVGGKIVAIAQPVARLTLAPAAGLVERAAGHRAEVATFLTPGEIDSALLIAGCDPAAAILADWLARHRAPVSAIALPCSSSRALDALVGGRAQVAGMHLRDPGSGEYNLAPVREALGRRRATVVTFARWELGLATAVPNRLGLHGVDDLIRRGVRIVNRERGAGARLALDEALELVGADATRIAGYGDEVGGHLEVAAAIAAGRADAGMTIRLAADAYGLGFITLREERYDLVIMDRELETPPVRAMLEALNSRRFAREVSDFCSYDTALMGRVVASANAAAGNR